LGDRTFASSEVHCSRDFPHGAAAMHRHTYTALYAHIVFATKARRPLILNTFRPLLHEYIDSIVENLGCTPIRTGGVADHVHVLLAARPDVAIPPPAPPPPPPPPSCVRSSFSSRFGWQRGYAAFSVSRSRVDSVARYIANQEEHHRRVPTMDELLMLFSRHAA